MLLILLCFVPSQVNAQAVPVGIAVGGDNLTRLLWNNPNGSISLWKIAADGSVATQNTYGPYAGWSGKSLATGTDNVSRILWTNTDGTAALWRVNGDGSSINFSYGPYSGWTATNVTVGGDNTSRLLWNNTSGQMAEWSVAADDTFTHGEFGPYTDYSAFRVAAGPNSIPRTLWNKTDGSISLWYGTTDMANFASSDYGPFAGYSPVALAVDSTNAPRVLWTHPSDSTISLWKVATDNTFAYQNSSNPAGYSPVGLAAGTGGDVRLLWSNGQGGAQVWTIQSNGTYTSITYPAPSALILSPSSITSGGTSTGTVTLNSPAPTNGAAVSLTSSNATAATVPASVTVAAGQTSATFSVTGQTVSATTAVTITVAYNGVSQTASLTVTVPAPVLTSITVSPASAGLSLNGTQQFSAVGKDQNGTVLSPQPSFTWSVVSGVGSINASGLYSAGATAGTATVKAASGSVSGTATVTVTNAAPTVATAASASPSPVTGTTTTLSALGADDGGAANLTYTWATTGTPPAAVTFSANGTNAAKTTTATFTQAGSYSFAVTIKDAGGLTATSPVTVTVNATLTSITVSPATATVTTGGTQQFGASAQDQFGAALSPPPAFTWSVMSGDVGSVSSEGLYSAGSSAGSATVKAASGSVSGTAAVTVTSATAALFSVTLDPATVAGGNPSTGTIILNSPAPTGGLAVTLSSNNAAATPSSTTIPGGQVSATFNIATMDVSATIAATITATAAGVSKAAILTVTSNLSLTAAATGANKITLYWNGIDGASGYNVYRGTVSGGPYTRVASNVATPDTGPGVGNGLIYSNTSGLTTGVEYFYVVFAVQSGAETVQSDEVSAIPDANAVSWDTGDAVLIVSQMRAIVANNLASDEPAVGELTIGGPNGVIYQSFQDGSPAKSYAPPGHYSNDSHTLVYTDGNEVPAPIDTADSAPGVPVASSLEFHFSPLIGLTSATNCPKFVQSLGLAYPPTKRPSGIFREVQTQPGYSSLLSYVGLPDVMDTSLSNIDSRPYKPGNPNSSKFVNSDTGYIYSGGTAYSTVQSSNGKSRTYASELDAGLMLVRTGDPKHPGWVPVINAPGYYFDAGFVGYPLEFDAAAANGSCCPYPQVFVSGEPLMSFKAPGFGTIPDGVVVMSYHAGTAGNVFRLVNGSKVQVGDITLVRAGLKGWNKKACIVIKRMNSIAQNFKMSPLPPALGPYTYAPFPNGPGNGFFLSGSYMKGASWGDINADDEAIDGINIYSYGQWDANLTWQEGSYPAPRTPAPGNPYVGDLQQNQFFWEQSINLHT